MAEAQRGERGDVSLASQELLGTCSSSVVECIRVSFVHVRTLC